MGRKRKSPEEALAHPTRDLIIKAAAAIMKEKGVTGLHIDDLMEVTDLTRGALYHHFKNVDDVVEHALLDTYAEGVNANISFVRNVLASASTFEEFRRGVFAANIAYVQNADLRAVRKLRAHAMAVSATAATLTVKLAREQQRLTDEYIGVITEARQRGWVRSSVEPRALATFIQAYSFGVIVDDVSEDHVDQVEWTRLIDTFFETCVFDDTAVQQ